MKRKAMTLEEHYEVATAIRQADEKIRLALTRGGGMLARDSDRLRRALRSLALAQSGLEDRMFEDVPHLGREWIGMYYGDQAEADKLIRSVRSGQNDSADTGRSRWG